MTITRTHFQQLISACLILWGLAGCGLSGSASPAAADPSTQALVVATATDVQRATLLPDPTEPILTSPPAETETVRPEAQVCSPFAGWDLARLTESISNPFHPPALGSDDPHQGVDFSDLDPDFGYAREGLAVQAVLPGTVAGVIAGRFPYGNAVLIETSIDDMPADLQADLNIPAEFPQPTVSSALTCPVATEVLGGGGGAQSLYLLYAHMQASPSAQVGDPVTCGQALGTVGGSGNALAPHLHVEARAGAAGQQFSGMAHYDVAASEVEMANYCAWRISGGFFLFDPMEILARLP
ncbi:MAG TPA: M23 family metallopeptidase [Anaerolineaceae bacterium]|nr:M23 family metallopeptidase [Anaerolineaceae bacterium]